MLLYVDDLLLCSPSRTSSQGDSIHWLKLLTLKKHKVTKEKLQFPQIQFLLLGHLTAEQRLHIDPDRYSSVLGFPKLNLSANCEVFFKPFGYCLNLIPDFSIIKSLYALLSIITTLFKFYGKNQMAHASSP